MTTVGVFRGPWETGHIALEGAIIGFSDIERCVRQAAGGERGAAFRVVDLDISWFLTGELARWLGDLDMVYANCGPLTALLYHIRDREGLKFRVVREVRTLGWVGYAFQEYVASELARPGDLCSHVSAYALEVWSALRGEPSDVHYYPLLDGGRIIPESPVNVGRDLRCGFFSRVTEDKGFQFVPQIIAKLKAADWPIAALELCGASDSPELLASGCRALEQDGVAVRCHGELDHRRSMSLMAEVDVVLFPSVSSVEGVGRVVIEACGLGKTVIASDYCAGRDVLTPAYRIPLRMPAPVTKSSAHPFAIAGLDLEAWEPPAPGSPSIRAEPCARYCYDADVFLGTFVFPQDATKLDSEPDHDLRMAFDFDRFEGLSKRAWCERVFENLKSEYRDRADLLDLGGAMKRSVMGAGFVPDVTFYRTT